MKPKHQRLIFVCVSVVCVCAAALLVAQAFRENIVFFYSPSELVAKSELPHSKLRIGGLVEKNSLKRGEDNAIAFIVTDGSNALTVHYQGLLPNLFREGQGVVVEGFATSKTEFAAQTILAKHDENYMPKEVVDALKQSGHWEYGKEK